MMIVSTLRQMFQRQPSRRRPVRRRLSVEALEDRLVPSGTVYEWKGGTSSDWNTPANWNVLDGTGTTFPGYQDEAIFDTNGVNTKCVLSGTTTVSGLILTDTSLTLDLQADLTVQYLSGSAYNVFGFYKGTIQTDNTSVLTPADLTLSGITSACWEPLVSTGGNFYLSADGTGSSSATGNLIVDNGASLIAEPYNTSTALKSDWVITASGASTGLSSTPSKITFDTSGSLWLTNANAKLRSLPSCLITWTGASDIVLQTASGSTPLALAVNGGTMDVACSGTPQLSVSGNVDTTAGVLKLEQGTTLAISGNYTQSAGGVVQRGGTTFEVDGSTLTTTGGTWDLYEDSGSGWTWNTTSTTIFWFTSTTFTWHINDDGAISLSDNAALYFNSCVFNAPLDAVGGSMVGQVAIACASGTSVTLVNGGTGGPSNTLNLGSDQTGLAPNYTFNFITTSGGGAISGSVAFTVPGGYYDANAVWEVWFSTVNGSNLQIFAL